MGVLGVCTRFWGLLHHFEGLFSSTSRGFGVLHEALRSFAPFVGAFEALSKGLWGFTRGFGGQSSILGAFWRLFRGLWRFARGFGGPWRHFEGPLGHFERLHEGLGSVAPFLGLLRGHFKVV